MRRVARVAFFAVALALATHAAAAPKEEELVRARVLDQQGVKAYKDGRYNDAIKYFSEAFKLGGPASELWNIAKCHLRLDEPEQASDAYDRYLMQQGLTAQDKSEARGELEELKRRRSTLTVASAPSRAAVLLDGRRGEAAGTTPFSVQVPPGTHKVEIELSGYRPFTQDIEAQYGRAIIVDAQLQRDPSQPLTPPPITPGDRVDNKTTEPATEASGRQRRFTAKAEVGVDFSRLGSASEGGRAAFTVSGAYWLLDKPRWAAGVGVLLHVTGDAWNNGIGAPATVPGCTIIIANDETATEIAGYGVGAFTYRVMPRVRVGADAGLGLAGYSAGALGGNLFYPTCQPSTGLQAAVRVGLEASYELLPFLRATLTPVALQLHPAYAGTRPGPVDASSAWMRFGLGLGLAVDL